MTDQTTNTVDALDQVAAAARAVVDGQGTPGAMARTTALRDAITNACDDTALAVTVHAVTVHAAVWLDRYGSQGAPDRLRYLAAALAAGDENRD